MGPAAGFTAQVLRDVSGFSLLQVDLDEFVFRDNRRRTPLAALQTLLGLGAMHQPSSYEQITRRRGTPKTE